MDNKKEKQFDSFHEELLKKIAEENGVDYEELCRYFVLLEDTFSNVEKSLQNMRHEHIQDATVIEEMVSFEYEKNSYTVRRYWTRDGRLIGSVYH